MKESLLFKKAKGTKNGAVECRTCSHFCTIEEGRTGVCGVRQNIRGKLMSLVYGRAAAVGIDPVEKKPLFHFLPGSKAFSFGTAGCNFRCANCQNFDISQIYGVKGKPEAYATVDWGEELSPADIVKQAKENGCESIAYTYNEPTVFLEYALDTMQRAKKAGLKNIWVSNGYMSNETLDEAIPLLDAVNVDIKSFDDAFYRKNSGASLAPVLANCKRLRKEGVWLETTTLIIPTLSDDEDMFRDIARFQRKELGEDVPWHVSAFSGAISWKLQHLQETPVEKVRRAWEIGKEEGLRYVYAGNVWKKDMESTYCPQCGDIVIERKGYTVFRRDADGSCAKCGGKVKGVFS